MPNWLRVLLSRILASIFLAMIGALARYFGFELDDDTKKEMVDGLLVFVLPLVFLLYGVAHKVLDRWISPGDTASGRLAVQAKLAREHLPPAN